jgi:hypothetical protein
MTFVIIALGIVVLFFAIAAMISMKKRIFP